MSHVLWQSSAGCSFLQTKSTSVNQYSIRYMYKTYKTAYYKIWHTESKLKVKFHELIESTTINIKVDLQL